MISRQRWREIRFPAALRAPRKCDWGDAGVVLKLLPGYDQPPDRRA